MPKQSKSAKAKPQHGPAANTGHGGPRVAGPGKKMGAPAKFGTIMSARRDVRLPVEWIKAIEAGYPNFSAGLRALIGKTELIQALTITE